MHHLGAQPAKQAQQIAGARHHTPHFRRHLPHLHPQRPQRHFIRLAGAVIKDNHMHLHVPQVHMAQQQKQLPLAATKTQKANQVDQAQAGFVGHLPFHPRPPNQRATAHTALPARASRGQTR